jgi:GTP-binding protein LepA
VDIANPADLPDASVRDRIEEPFVKLEMFAPSDYVGSLMELAQVHSPYTGPHTTPSAW